MKKLYILLIVICIGTLLYGKERNIKINEIGYYGTFNSQNYIKKAGIKDGYFQNPGEDKKIKLPAKIENWPANEIFDMAPEVVIVKAEIENRSNEIINNLLVEVKMRYKISKLYYDEDEYIDEKKCMKNLKWDNYFINNQILIKSIKGKSKKIIEVGRFNMYADNSNYDNKGLIPWFCQTELNIADKDINKIKDFEINYVW